MAIPEYPISRVEHYLARANGQNVQPPDPISRIEHYLAGIAGGVPQELLDDVANLKSQLETKAEIDGYYQDMTVGDAEQMISTQYVEDTEPYLYRTTGGTSDVGNREYVRKIVGGTLAWNQLVNAVTADGGISGVTITGITGGRMFSGTATETVTTNLDASVVPFQKEHVYIISAVSGGSASTYYFGTTGSGSFSVNKFDTYVFKPTASSREHIRLTILNGATVTNLKAIPQVFDLTAMFGSTIADHIYQLEQTTAGAGVAFFRKLFPLDYYPYDAGSLKSVEGLQSHEMVGFNQWDEEWEVGNINLTTGADEVSYSYWRTGYIRVLPNTSYYASCASVSSVQALRGRLYDANKNYIGYTPKSGSFATNSMFTTTDNTHYVRFAPSISAILNHDICINLSWSGTRNGEYEPYVKHSYVLDDSLTLRGVPKLSDDGKLMYDGDRYLPDGTVERRYGIVDLGTLNWTWSSAYGAHFTDLTTLKKVASNDNYVNAISPMYISSTYTMMASTTSQIQYTMAGRPSDSRLYVRTDGTEETKPTGILVYELATPTTETATPYPEVQLCDDWGTERFVTDSIVPVGTETDYPANLRDKLQHLPDLASADGYYAIKQVGTQMTLEPFRIPKAPTTDGSYTLRATVSGGVPTYTWEQEVVVTASEEA